MKNWFIKSRAKALAYLLVCGIVLAVSISVTVYAGFGDYNDYDSGSSYDSDWGSSYDSDWGSSYDSDWSSSYSSSSGSGGNGISVSSVAIIIIFVLIIYIRYRRLNNKTGTTRSASSTPKATSSAQGRNLVLPDRTTLISERIKEHDPLFTAPDFISYVKQVYMDIQAAWCNRDLNPVRVVLHQNLYAQTERQIEKKLQDGIKNNLERISVQTTYLTSYRKDEKYEYLVVYLTASMIDYQIKEATGQVIYGDKSTRWNMRYKMTFMRSLSCKTRDNGDKERGMICPNCGAPLQGTSFGKCQYCDSVITTGDYDWVLSDFGTVRDDTIDEGLS